MRAPSVLRPGPHPLVAKRHIVRIAADLQVKLAIGIADRQAAGRCRCIRRPEDQRRHTRQRLRPRRVAHLKERHRPRINRHVNRPRQQILRNGKSARGQQHLFAAIGLAAGGLDGGSARLRRGSTRHIITDDGGSAFLRAAAIAPSPACAGLMWPAPLASRTPSLPPQERRRRETLLQAGLIRDGSFRLRARLAARRFVVDSTSPPRQARRRGSPLHV